MNRKPSERMMIRRAMDAPERYAIGFEYEDSEGVVTRRTVSPIRWVAPDAFLALCLAREEPRRFVLDRCKDFGLVDANECLMPMPIETLKGRTMNATLRKIEIENIGPIHHLTIPLPEGGGVVVLQGGQGVGKSTALNCVKRAIGGDINVNLSPTDGEKSGKVEIGECTLKVFQSQTRKSGELVVESIESRLDLGALVDPGIADQEKADAKRIRSLLALTGVAADETAYYDLVGGKETFKKLNIECDSNDPLVLAQKVKTAIEKHARKAEDSAESLKGEAKALVPGRLPESVAEESVLAAELSAASVRVQALKTRKDNRAKQLESRRLAEESLEAMTAGSITSENAQKKVTANELMVKRLEKQLQAAQADLTNSKNELTAAINRETQQATYRKTLDAVMDEAVSDEEILEAEQAEAAAKRAVETAVLVRKQLADAELAKTKRSEATAQAAKGARLREMAAKVNDVLSSLIPKGKLRCKDGRLVTPTDRSEHELFSDLSEGEKWNLVIDIAADNLRPDGLLVIPQVAWEGLTDNTRSGVVRKAKERAVVIMTAEAKDTELSAKVV